MEGVEYLHRRQNLNPRMRIFVPFLVQKTGGRAWGRLPPMSQLDMIALSSWAET